MPLWMSVLAAQITVIPVTVSYTDTVLPPGSNSKTLSPTTLNGSGTKTYSYTGTLPTSVTFNTSTGVITGPSSADWTLAATSLSMSGSMGCAVTTAGGIYCWGNTNDISLTSAPTTGVASVSTNGTSVICYVTTGGGAKCWGNNFFGTLGDGTTTTRTSPVDVSGLTSGVASISVGWRHACAVLTSGAIRCWGDNTNGALGSGTTTTVNGCLYSGTFYPDPQIPQSTCSAISGTWTSQTIGASSTTPVAVSGITSGATMVSARGLGGANGTTCAVVSGSARCWGDNSQGQLGNASTTNSLTPVTMSGLTSGVTFVQAHEGSTCAVHNGALKCCGSGFGGAVAPAVTAGLSSGVASVAVGGNSANCVRTTTNGVKCWGNDNRLGQLGDGTTTSSSTPVDVTGLTSGVSAVSGGGGSNFCALTTTNGVRCWGRNLQRELSDGTTTNRSSQVTAYRIPTGFPASINVSVTDLSGVGTAAITLATA